VRVISSTRARHFQITLTPTLSRSTRRRGKRLPKPRTQELTKVLSQEQEIAPYQRSREGNQRRKKGSFWFNHHDKGDSLFRIFCLSFAACLAPSLLRGSLSAALIFLSVFTFRIQQACADDSPAPPTTAPAVSTEIAPVVVTANRVPTPASEVGSSVSVISSDDLDHEQVPLVSDALRYVPSVNVTRSGGPGQITSVFTRGADSDHTLVLIDGIQANDPTSPTGAFDFSTLTVDDIDHIEVIRGPQSTLWGSNAIGGVINIITKRGEGPLGGYVYTDDGSFNTYREGLGVSGGNKTVNYSLSRIRRGFRRPTRSSATPSRTATTSAP
jgi:outer membrane receptor protein involved in Fe transport